MGMGWPESRMSWKEAVAGSLPTHGQANGILVTGGVDINPATYGEEPLPQVDPPFDDLDQFEISLIRRAIDRDLPIFGICRGKIGRAHV